MQFGAYSPVTWSIPSKEFGAYSPVTCPGNNRTNREPLCAPHVSKCNVSRRHCCGTAPSLTAFWKVSGAWAAPSQLLNVAVWMVSYHAVCLACLFCALEPEPFASSGVAAVVYCKFAIASVHVTESVRSHSHACMQFVLAAPV
eukprot:1156843-Pelagomonas_calceolata.AAC.3